MYLLPGTVRFVMQLEVIEALTNCNEWDNTDARLSQVADVLANSLSSPDMAHATLGVAASCT